MMMKRKTSILIIAVALLVTLAGIFSYTIIYNKPHTDVATSSPHLSVDSNALLHDFLSDEIKANATYLEQILQVNGLISEITITENGNGIITLADKNNIGGVICHVSKEENKKLITLKKGQTINIKGICTGYLMDVILVKCVIVN